MEIRWSPAAAQDLFHIIEYIRRENVAASRRVASAIHEVVGSLSSFPHRGRTGRVEGTRELALFTPIYYCVSIS
jgi:plasmid stabilization system protein ParE